MKRSKKQHKEMVQKIIPEKYFKKVIKDLEADGIVIVVYQKKSGTAVSSQIKGAYATLNIMNALEETGEQIRAKMIGSMDELVNELEGVVKKVVKSGK